MATGVLGTGTATGQTDFYYDGTNVVEEHQGGIVTAQYVWAPDGTLVLRDSYNPSVNGGIANPLIPNASGSTLDQRIYALTDAFNNTVAITDIAGNMLERYVYDANGRPQPLSPYWAPYPTASSSSGPDQYTSSVQYNWQYLYHGARWVQLFTNWTSSVSGGTGAAGSSTTYFGGGLNEYAGGVGGFYSSNDGRPVTPNLAAEIGGGNARMTRRRWGSA